MKRGIAASIIWMALVVSPAHAVVTDPTIDVVGEWGGRSGCIEGAFSFIRNEGNLFRLVLDNGTVYRTRLQVQLSGDMLHLIDDEKKYSYRIVSDKRIEFVGFTDLNSGLSAHTRPKMWHRCEPG